MKFRTLVLSVLAVGCGLAASILTARYLNGNPAESHVSVLVAQKPIPRGSTLRDYESLFTLKEVSGGSPLPFHYVGSFEELREKARDHVIDKEMKPGEPLARDYLKDRKGLRYQVRGGFVALAVRATPESSFDGLIQPDNYVKVLRVKAGPGGERTTQILMQNIRVLAVGPRRDPQQDGAAPVPTTITLEVTDQEAKTLAVAQTEAPLVLALIPHGSEGKPDDRAGEANVPERHEPPPPAVVASAPAPRAEDAPVADFQTDIREGDQIRRHHYSKSLGRYFRTETLPGCGEK